MAPYPLLLELTVLLAAWLCLGVFQKERATPGRCTFILLGVSGAVWCLGELVQVRGIADEVVADRIKYAGVLALPPFWLGVAAHGARLDLVRRVAWFPLVLLAPQVCAYALLFAGPWGSLFLTTVPGGDDLRGPLWWILTAFNYVLVVAGSLILVATAIRHRSGAWVRQLLLGVASFFPLAANVAYLHFGLAWSHDPTPAVFGVSLLALRSAAFSGGLLQILPVSQQDLLSQLPLPALLADRRGTVIAVNPEAERWLGIPTREAMGRTLDAVLDRTESGLHANTSPLRSHGREAGQLVLLESKRSR
jgi:PAS domain-containing protein